MTARAGELSTGTRALILSVSLALVCALIGFTVLGRTEHRTARGPAATAAVRGYLSALQHGDADRALSYGADRPRSAFLTGAVLSAQQRVAPLRIDGLDPAVVHGDRATVRAHLHYGNTAVTTLFALVDDGGRWRLPTAALSVRPTPAAPALRLFGRPVTPGHDVVAFPGALQWTTDSARIAVAGTTLVTQPGARAITPLTLTLTDQGRADALVAVRSALALCVSAGDPDPPGCPQHPGDLDVGTDRSTYDARWQAPSDLSGVRLLLDPARPANLIATGRVDLTGVPLDDNGAPAGPAVTVPYMIEFTEDLASSPLFAYPAPD